ncbi:hypothetical protein SSBG_01599 [Streptomyces sp. SPB074]|nr:hypothetical protein SSBG_01599 [Streptomyces sp. SPB074]
MALACDPFGWRLAAGARFVRSAGVVMRFVRLTDGYGARSVRSRRAVVARDPFGWRRAAVACAVRASG